MMTRANGMKKERSMAAVFLLFAFSFGSYEMGFPLGRLASYFEIGKLFLWKDTLKDEMIVAYCDWSQS